MLAVAREGTWAVVLSWVVGSAKLVEEVEVLCGLEEVDRVVEERH